MDDKHSDLWEVERKVTIEQIRKHIVKAKSLDEAREIYTKTESHIESEIVVGNEIIFIARVRSCP